MKHFKHILISLMLLAGQSWAAFSLAVSVPVGGSTDVDVRPPTLIAQVPAQNSTVGETLKLDLGHYLSCAPYFGSPVNNCVWSWLTAPASPLTWSISSSGVLTLTGGTAGVQTGLKLRVTSSYGGSTIINSNAFTWTVTAVPPPPGGGALIAATGVFIDCGTGYGVGGGSDAAAGTVAAPWKTMARASGVGGAAVTTPGTDIWLKSGSICDEELDYNVAGGIDAVTNRQIIGTYKLVSGVAYEDRPDNDGAQMYGSELVYTDARAKIRGTYLQSCRTNGENNTTPQTPLAGPWNSGKCAFDTRLFVGGGVNGNYGPLGNLHVARPDTRNGGLVTVRFAANKKYVTFQDIEIEGSAGSSVQVAGATAGDGSANCYGNDVCRGEMIFDRVLVHHSADIAITFQGISRIAVRQSWFHDIKLQTGDFQYGFDTGGGMVNPTKCAPCEFLIEGSDFTDQYGEAVTAYFISHMVARGNRIGHHSMSNGMDNFMVYDSNIMFGSELTHSPPATNTRFPFWAMVGENPGNNDREHLRPSWLSPQNTFDRISRGMVRRNNIVIRGKMPTSPTRAEWTFGLSANRYPSWTWRVCPSSGACSTVNVLDSNTPPATPSGGSVTLTRTESGPFVWVHETIWDFNNTVVIGDQPSAPVNWLFRDLRPGCSAIYPFPSGPASIASGPGSETSENVNVAGCRPDIEPNGTPASFLNHANVENNLFIVQDGKTPAVAAYCLFSKGTGGSLTMGHNGFTNTAASNSCSGTGNLIGATFANWGMTARDHIAMEWYKGTLPSEDDFRPAIAGAGNNAGADLSGTDATVLPDDGYMDWMVANMKWRAKCNATGLTPTKAQWLQKNALDFCGNPRGGANGWDLGARINAAP